MKRKKRAEQTTSLRLEAEFVELLKRFYTNTNPKKHRRPTRNAGAR